MISCEADPSATGTSLLLTTWLGVERRTRHVTPDSRARHSQNASATAHASGMRAALADPSGRFAIMVVARITCAPSPLRPSGPLRGTTNRSAAARTLRQALTSPGASANERETQRTRDRSRPSALRLPARRESIGPLCDMGFSQRIDVRGKRSLDDKTPPSPLDRAEPYDPGNALTLCASQAAPA